MNATFGDELTAPVLIRDLRTLGVTTGSTLLVHSSLRSLGRRVAGGAGTVVDALLGALGPSGTLVVPAQSPQCQDPSRWSHTSPPDYTWARLRHTLPPFDPARTPSVGMGALAERVRTWPGAVRSGHPLTSFAAVGPAAAGLMAGHEVDSLLGPRSPLARLEEADAQVLLLGVGYDRCTSFHLAEYRLPDPRRRTVSCVVDRGAGREWIRFDTIELDASDFDQLGKDLENSTGWVRRGPVAAAEARLLPVAPATAFARRWLLRHRLGIRPPSPTGPPQASVGRS